MEVKLSTLIAVGLALLFIGGLLDPSLPNSVLDALEASAPKLPLNSFLHA